MLVTTEKGYMVAALYKNIS